MISYPILLYADRLPPLIGGMEIHALHFIRYFSTHPSYPLMRIITKNSSGDDESIDINPNILAPKVIFFNSGRWIEELNDIRLAYPDAKFIYRTGGNEIIKAPLNHQNIDNHRTRQQYWANTLNKTIDILITNSEFTENRLREIGITCPFERCVGGVDTTLSRNVKTKMNKITRFFCAARFVSYKNHHTLITILSELQNQNYRFECYFAGDGPLLNDCKSLVSKLSLDYCVHFLGAIENSTVCKHIANADIYVQLSSDFITEVKGGNYTHCEGMGRSILEAISAGTFVICASSGALSEIVTPERGYLINLNNTETILSEFIIGLQHAKNTICQKTEQYDWKHLFHAYEGIMS